MSPLTRPIAVVGLLALLVTAWLLTTGQLSLAEAGTRALLVLVVAKVVDRLATWGLRRAALAAAQVSHRGRIVAGGVEAEEA